MPSRPSCSSKRSRRWSGNGRRCCAWLREPSAGAIGSALECDERGDREPDFIRRILLCRAHVHAALQCERVRIRSGVGLLSPFSDERYRGGLRARGFIFMRSTSTLRSNCSLMRATRSRASGCTRPSGTNAKTRSHGPSTSAFPACGALWILRPMAGASGLSTAWGIGWRGRAGKSRAIA